MATISGQPSAVTSEAATREHIDSIACVSTGTPAHSTSVPVVWPLHIGVSRKTSASEPRAMYGAFSTTSMKMMRAGSMPSRVAASVTCGAASAGKRSSQIAELGTARRIAHLARGRMRVGAGDEYEGEDKDEGEVEGEGEGLRA